MSAIAAAIILASLGTQPGAADEVASFTLPHGDYVDAANTCENFGFAGVIAYDGRGFSPNHLTCKTVATGEPDTFLSTCIDNTTKAPADDLTAKINQLSATSFKYDGHTLNYCKGK